MAGNRVEELEAKVRELEATIDGLTDELVETKERLQAVEAEAGVEEDVLAGRPGRSDRSDRSDRSADPEEQSEPPTDEPEAGDGEASADDVNSDEAEGEDNADSESGDDIIVA